VNGGRLAANGGFRAAKRSAGAEHLRNLLASRTADTQARAIVQHDQHFRVRGALETLNALQVHERSAMNAHELLRPEPVGEILQ
jgi:hypothetical protein